MSRCDDTPITQHTPIAACHLCREVHGSSASAQDLCSKIILSDALALASICDHSLRDLAPNDERVAELGEIVPRHASGWTCLPRVWQVCSVYKSAINASRVFQWHWQLSNCHEVSDEFCTAGTIHYLGDCNCVILCDAPQSLAGVCWQKCT